MSILKLANNNPNFRIFEFPTLDFSEYTISWTEGSQSKNGLQQVCLSKHHILKAFF